MKKIMNAVECLNQWDVQSKHIVLPTGICESLCSGEKRWGALPPNVCYEVNDGQVYESMGSAEQETVSD